MRPSSSSRVRRPLVGLVLPCWVLLGVLFAACLPTGLHPTPAPPGSPTPAPTAAPTPTPTPGPPTPTPGPTFALYRVVRGDSLTSVALKFQTSGRSLAYWNRDRYPTLDPESAGYQPDRLETGWVLRVIPGHEYVPPPGDGETGVQESATPDAGGDGSGGASGSPPTSPGTPSSAGPSSSAAPSSSG